MPSPLSKLFGEVRKTALAAIVRLTFLAWCEANVRMPDDGPKPGRFRLDDDMAFLRELYEFLDDPRYTEGGLMKIPQTGGSTWLLNAIQFRCATIGKNTLYFTSTTDEAKKMMRREIKPRWERCGILQRLVLDDPDAVTNSRIEMANGTLYVIGGQSANSAGSTPSPTAAVDESDKIKISSGTEAHVGELAAARTKRFPYEKKLIYVSTPTSKSGYIWIKYSDPAASRGHYHMRCPHCGLYQELKFDAEKRLRCDNPKNADGSYDFDRVKRETYYLCRGPKACKIQQRAKREMVRTGKWVHENPDSMIRTWHVSGFLSPDYSWGELLATFFRFKAQPGGLQKFYNEFLGLPFDAPAVSTDAKDIQALADTSPLYLRGTLPFEPANIAIFADTQTAARGFWWVIVAWDYEQNIAVLDWGQAAGLDDLVTLAGRSYDWQGLPFVLSSGMLDLAGDRTGDIYDFALENLGFWFPSQGRSPKHGLFTPVRHQNREWKGQEILFIQFLDDMFKQELYYKKIQQRSGKRLYLPSDYAAGDSFLAEQLTNEVRFERADGSFGWGDKDNHDRTASNNHLGDCLKQALVGGTLMAASIENARLELEAEKAAAKAALPAAA